TDGLSVWSVNGKHADSVDCCCNDACLWIDNFVTKRWTHIMRLIFRKNRDAIVRFLSVINRVITSWLQGEHRKLFVRTFRFLQTNDVRFVCLEPRKQAILAFAQGIDVPGRDSHHLP